MSKALPKYLTDNTFTLRGTVIDDVETLVEIINEAYSYQNEVKGEKRTNPRHLKDRISQTNFYTVLANYEIVGCVYLESKKTSLHFGLLTLAPKYRGKGIAKSIINAIDLYANDSHFVTIELDYMSLAPWLKKYYEKYGFIETGEVTLWGKINLVRMSKMV